MANKLKDIFSNDTPEYKSTLKFKDSDAYRSFRAALNAVEQEGCSMPIEGVDSIATYMQLHGIQFPLDKQTNISDLTVLPVKDHINYSVIWDGREKVFNFDLYRITTGLVLETEKQAVVYMKLIFSEDTQKVKITYQLQYHYAKSISEIEFEMNACITFLTKFYAPTKDMGNEEDKIRMDEIFHYLRCASGFISRLCAVEKVLGLSFSTEMLNTMTGEDQQDVEELYLLLCQKVPLRLNAKINSTDATNIEVADLQAEPMIGKQIALAFIREVHYELLGQEFLIFTANALMNAVIKDIHRYDEKTTIFYGDTDSQPMYISFSGFLTEELAREETNRNICGEDAYINARTSAQYIKEYYTSTK